MASMLLAHAGIARAEAAPAYKPTKRGGGGALKAIFWQGPTLLNPHFAGGTKDQEGSRIFYEPLAAWDDDGNLVPVLAAEIPSLANGGLAADGRSVTWKLKRGVTWHDGQPFTADDCVFTFDYVKDPATAATTAGTYEGVTIRKVDAYTVRIAFTKPTPNWYETLVSSYGAILPRHVFGPYVGARAREAPANLRPVGTGPYKFADFKPGDSVRGAINTAYHLPNRPFFDTIEIKGGGDATSAARAVLQTGEFDYGWNLQVEDEVLKRMESSGKGRTLAIPSGDIEFIQLNPTDPWNEVEGERASVKSHHFAFADPKVREAMALLCDRKGMQDFVYGRTGTATGHFLSLPVRYRSPNGRWEFNVDKAGALLDAAGWKKGADGVREKGGKRLALVFQTSINGTRQKEQAIVKQSCQKAGIAVELKSVAGSVFFLTDVGNPDTFGKFWADMQMFTWMVGSQDPAGTMRQFLTSELSQKSNKWQSRNNSRWSSAEYDAAFAASEAELDPVKRAAHFIRMNDLVVGGGCIVPLVNRSRVRGAATKLVPTLSAWDLDFAFLHDWYRDA
jgi:peptide/nickel transport system substrate-binding protein